MKADQKKMDFLAIIIQPIHSNPRDPSLFICGFNFFLYSSKNVGWVSEA